MLTSGGFDAKARRRKPPGSAHASDPIIALAKGNTDKALVLKYIGRLVAEGVAAWELRENGDIELRFHSGETYLLAEAAILRLA